MVSQDDMYPSFPLMECSVCQERFESSRKWVATRGYGNQILIDWEAVQLLMSTHHKMHTDDLIQGTEAYLAAQGPR